MHVFVVGATGVIGRALLPRLIEADHQVTGLARTPEKLLAVGRMGAAAARGDILDADGLHRLLSVHKPDVAVNLATSIPLNLKIQPEQWEQNDRIRSQGTLNLVRACEASAVKLLVQESVGYVCASRGAEWIVEGSPRSAHSFLKATVAMEDIVRSSALPGVLLRFAALMSPESWHVQQSVAALRRGMLPIVGDGSSYLSMIHAEDTALAILAALERPQTSAGRTYNVVDDSPATMAEVIPYAASLLQAPTPKHVPPFLAKLVAGSLTIDILTASYRMSGARIRTELDFKPRYSTFRETWQQIAGALGGKELPLSTL